jgi:hypothetical protein
MGAKLLMRKIFVAVFAVFAASPLGALGQSADAAPLETHSLRVNAGLKESTADGDSLRNSVVDVKAYQNPSPYVTFGLGVRHSKYESSGGVSGGEGYDVSLDLNVRAPRLPFGVHAGLVGYAKAVQTVYTDHKVTLQDDPGADSIGLERPSTTASLGVEWITGLVHFYSFSMVAEAGYSWEQFKGRAKDGAPSRGPSGSATGLEFLAGLQLTH